jgi:hypothetical protein
LETTTLIDPGQSSPTRLALREGTTKRVNRRSSELDAAAKSMILIE